MRLYKGYVYIRQKQQWSCWNVSKFRNCSICIDLPQVFQHLTFIICECLSDCTRMFETSGSYAQRIKQISFTGYHHRVCFEICCCPICCFDFRRKMIFFQKLLVLKWSCTLWWHSMLEIKTMIYGSTGLFRLNFLLYRNHRMRQMDPEAIEDKSWLTLSEYIESCLNFLSVHVKKFLKPKDCASTKTSV